ncbi:MAG: T9SS type A sorting domain-containing protein, partial [Candidatus Cloacimonetes bacterium]|nr:T9SS type A sorting domain-containing protein [Candidatus Cloacimonadota bacterium]
LTNNNYHTQIELFQNFPNPFIPDNDKRGQGTEIGFYLTPSTRSDLAIYNLKGELIRKFEDSYPQNSAYRTVNWNGRDRNGNIVPAGVYLYQLKTDGRSITRKMVILP